MKAIAWTGALLSMLLGSVEANAQMFGPPKFGRTALEYEVSHDARGTHIDWALTGVTAEMIDWFWSNMEKGFVLWHPEEHELLEWPVPPKHGDLRGAVHNAPQTWSDGRRQDLFIRFEPIEALTPEEREVIEHEHVLIACGLGSTYSMSKVA